MHIEPTFRTSRAGYLGMTGGVLKCRWLVSTGDLELALKETCFDTRFSDSFLIVTPGITIRDRPHVLRPR